MPWVWAIESLAELHDVEAALTERGTDRGRGVRLARRHLQLDETDDLLGHCGSCLVSGNALSVALFALLFPV